MGQMYSRSVELPNPFKKILKKTFVLTNVSLVITLIPRLFVAFRLWTELLLDGLTNGVYYFGEFVRRIGEMVHDDRFGV